MVCITSLCVNELLVYLSFPFYDLLIIYCLDDTRNKIIVAIEAIIEDVPGHINNLCTSEAITFYGDISKRCEEMHILIASLLDNTNLGEQYSHCKDIIRKRLGKLVRT